MNLSIHDTPYLLALSILSATASLIIKPSGCQTFIEDVKWNILSFSPFRSGRMVLHLVIYLIHLRFLNLAEINAILSLLSHFEFPSKSHDVGHGLRRSLTRRVLLLGGTLPLFAILLASTSDRWMHAFVASLVADPVLAEVLWFYRESSHDGFTVRTGWPSRVMLIANPLVKADHLANDDSDKEGIKAEKEKEGTKGETPATLRDNLCDRIDRLRSNEADSEINFASSSLPPEHYANLDRILSTNVRVSKWTCGHWRCLVYVILHVAMRIISFSWYIEHGLIFWLLHVDIHPATLQVSEKMLKNNVIGGVLTGFYQIFSVVILFAGVHYCFRLLFIRLTKVECINQFLQGLAVSAPITFKGIVWFIQLFVPNFLGFLLIQATTSWTRSLTTEILACAMEILVILIICIIGYRLLLRGSSNSKSSLKPDTPPESDTQTMEASASRQASSNDNGNAPQGRSEYPRLLICDRFQIFRLAISVPTMVVWVFLRCYISFPGRFQ